MDQNELFVQNANDFEKNMHDFMAVEVNKSLTFADIALGSGDEQRR